MNDALFAFYALSFAAATYLLIVLCERLMGGRQ
jgi:hypothetical protein